MRLILAAVAVSALALPAAAQNDARWTSGYGQGIHEASVRNASGAQFSVSCPDGSPTARPGLLLTLPELEGGETIDAVDAAVTVDGAEHPWRLDRKVQDQNQVVFAWEAAGPQTAGQLSDLITRLRNGNSMTVSVPGDRVEETFALAGSSAALEVCAGA